MLLRSQVDKPLALVVDELNGDCTDQLHVDNWFPTSLLFLSFADIMRSRYDINGNGSLCTGGCFKDGFKSLCSAHRCVTVTCADARHFCNEDSKAGERARMFCPATCGCNNVTAPMLYIGSSKGCPTACAAQREQQAKLRPCKDAEANSPDIRAVLEKLKDLAGHIWSTYDLPTDRCSSKLPEWLCPDGGAQEGIKGLMNWCPVSCQ